MKDQFHNYELTPPWHGEKILLSDGKVIVRIWYPLGDQDDTKIMYVQHGVQGHDIPGLMMAKGVHVVARMLKKLGPEYELVYPALKELHGK